MEAEEDDSTEVEQKPNNNDTDSDLGTEDPLEISEAIATMSRRQRVTHYLNPAQEALEAIFPRLQEALASCQDEAILEGLQDSIIQINLRADNYLSTFSYRKPGYVANALKQLLPHNSPRSRGDSVDVVCGSPKRRRGIDQTRNGNGDTASAEIAKGGRNGNGDTASAENAKDGRGDAERDRSTEGLPRALKQLLPHNSPRSRGDSVDVVCGSPKRRRGIDQTEGAAADSTSIINSSSNSDFVETTTTVTTTTSIVESSKHDVPDISSDYLNAFGNVPQPLASSHSRELEKLFRTYNTPAGSESHGGRKETDNALNSSYTGTKKRGSTLSSGVIESASIRESDGVTDKEGTWSCHVCTLHNKETDARCAICGAVRPRTAVATAKPLKLVQQYHRKIVKPGVKGSADGSALSSKSEVTIPEEQFAVVKRKRGRPKKVSTELVKDTSEKKRRGRPKKVEVEESTSDNNFDDDQPCKKCGGYQESDLALLCDGCNECYHSFCVGLGRDLSQILNKDWFCEECVSKRKTAVSADATSASLCTSIPKSRHIYPSGDVDDNNNDIEGNDGDDDDDDDDDDVKLDRADSLKTEVLRAIHGNPSAIPQLSGGKVKLLRKLLYLALEKATPPKWEDRVADRRKGENRQNIGKETDTKKNILCVSDSSSDDSDEEIPLGKLLGNKGRILDGSNSNQDICEGASANIAQQYSESNRMWHEELKSLFLSTLSTKLERFLDQNQSDVYHGYTLLQHAVIADCGAKKRKRLIRTILNFVDQNPYCILKIEPDSPYADFCPMLSSSRSSNGRPKDSTYWHFLNALSDPTASFVARPSAVGTVVPAYVYKLYSSMKIAAFQRATALQLAVMYGDTETAQLLLDTTIRWVLSGNLYDFDDEVPESVLKGFEGNLIDLVAPSSRYMTPLAIACFHGDLNMIRVLAGGSPDCTFAAPVFNPLGTNSVKTLSSASTIKSSLSCYDKMLRCDADDNIISALVWLLPRARLRWDGKYDDIKDDSDRRHDFGCDFDTSEPDIYSKGNKNIELKSFTREMDEVVQAVCRLFMEREAHPLYGGRLTKEAAADQMRKCLFWVVTDNNMNVDAHFLKKGELGPIGERMMWRAAAHLLYFGAFEADPRRHALSHSPVSESGAFISDTSQNFTDPVAPLPELNSYQGATVDCRNGGFHLGPLHIAILARDYNLLARILTYCSAAQCDTIGRIVTKECLKDCKICDEKDNNQKKSSGDCGEGRIVSISSVDDNDIDDTAECEGNSPSYWSFDDECVKRDHLEHRRRLFLPLHECIRSRWNEGCMLLLNRGADVNKREPISSLAAASSPQSLPTPSAVDKSPLMLAVQECFIDRSEDGSGSRGSLSIVALLLQYENLRIDTQDERGNTVLHHLFTFFLDSSPQSPEKEMALELMSIIFDQSVLSVALEGNADEKESKACRVTAALGVKNKNGQSALDLISRICSRQLSSSSSSHSYFSYMLEDFCRFIRSNAYRTSFGLSESLSLKIKCRNGVDVSNFEITKEQREEMRLTGGNKISTLQSLAVELKNGDSLPRDLVYISHCVEGSTVFLDWETPMEACPCLEKKSSRSGNAVSAYHQKKGNESPQRHSPGLLLEASDFQPANGCTYNKNTDVNGILFLLDLSWDHPDVHVTAVGSNTDEEEYDEIAVQCANLELMLVDLKLKVVDSALMAYISRPNIDASKQARALGHSVLRFWRANLKGGSCGGMPPNKGKGEKDELSGKAEDKMLDLESLLYNGSRVPSIAHLIDAMLCLEEDIFRPDEYDEPLLQGEGNSATTKDFQKNDPWGPHQCWRQGVEKVRSSLLSQTSSEGGKESSNGCTGSVIKQLAWLLNVLMVRSQHYTPNYFMQRPQYMQSREGENHSSSPPLRSGVSQGSCDRRSSPPQLKRFERYTLRDGGVIHECNRYCGCPSSCPGRLVQYGAQPPLVIYSAGQGKGLGVKSTVFLPKNTFVCEYAGEIFRYTDNQAREEAYDRSGHDEYILPFNVTGVKKNDKDRLAIDATRKGNVARFLNHSCDPNLRKVEVFVDHKSFSRVAFFTKRDVPPNTELTWSYGETTTEYHKDASRKRCTCGSSKCKGFLSA